MAHQNECGDPRGPALTPADTASLVGPVLAVKTLAYVTLPTAVFALLGGAEAVGISEYAHFLAARSAE
ncbi:hypothetical protein [Haloarcula brevis]|uniref:hypothetical protein n=1 Tax=Haloarcula brevis TaxID=3111453 RepID=UPI00300EBEFB